LANQIDIGMVGKGAPYLTSYISDEKAKQKQLPPAQEQRL